MGDMGATSSATSSMSFRTSNKRFRIFGDRDWYTFETSGEESAPEITLLVLGFFTGATASARKLAAC